MTQSRPVAGDRRYGLSVFIGRFSPSHLGHLAVILQALRVANHVLICIGSANAARSEYYVPFTASEREVMIRLMLSAEDNKRVSFAYIEDQGNMPKWTAQVRKAANAIEPNNSNITLIGHSKDNSSFYLKGFPGWKSVDVDNYMALSATNFRARFFARDIPGGMSSLFGDGLHDEVAHWLVDFAKTEHYEHLVEERASVEATKAEYGEGPFITGTATVIQADHVLLIKRGRAPFKGYWAMPGGFLEPKLDRSVVDAAVRELREETTEEKAKKSSLKVPELVLRRSIIRTDFYDAPWRDPRGRILDFNTLFYLNPSPPVGMTDTKEIEKYLAIPRIKGGDDADDAKFWAIADLRRDMMAFDHWMQLQNALDYIPGGF
jgi:bifunctional NMN adenylyltransferase/nudix hydrolase